MKALFLLLFISLSGFIDAQITIYSSQSIKACWNGEDYLNCADTEFKKNEFIFSKNFTELKFEEKVYFLERVNYEQEKEDEALLYNVINKNEKKWECVIIDPKNDLVKLISKGGEILMKYLVYSIEQNGK